MGAPERDSGDPLTALEDLVREGRRVPFYALVALLERLTGTVGKVGLGGSPAEEAIFFRSDPSLGFASSDVTQVRQVKPDGADPFQRRRARVEVSTTFLGLSGASSPLPLYLTEEVAQEDPDRPARREFLDLFHHRLLSLLYFGVTSYSVTHAPAADATDAWSRRILALLGVDTYERPAASGLGPAGLLRLSALLVTRNRTARSLELALEDVLSDALEGGGVRVRQFVGSWVDIDPAQRTHLGRANSVLGTQLVLGSRAYDRTGRIELEVGPVSRAVYERFLPGGDLIGRVAAVIELFSRDVLEYGVVVRLRAEEAPMLRLSAKDGSRLGRDSWLQRPEAGECRITVPAA